MINSNFEFTTNLQYKVKALTARVEAFETGDKYVTMNSEFKRQLAAKDREIRKLKQELALTNRQVVIVRENWLQVIEDIQAEHTKALQIKDHKIEKLQKRLEDKEEELTATKAMYRDNLKELYQVKTDLEEERGKSQKLLAQMNQDYETSSIPSSMNMRRKKITNNREKTDKLPGGQPGHEGHKRRRLVPTQTVSIPAPKEYANRSKYRPTGKTITKQLIDLQVDVVVLEYSTPEYRNIHTGQRVHAPFPDGVINEVNYGGSVKSFALLLNSYCCVSIDKVREFLCELTDGKLQISKGMINGLNKEFSKKTATEQKVAFTNILRAPVMNTDFTSVRLNGESAQINVCATPEIVMYFAREHKGHEGVKGTPVETFQGILVHDHDLTFYNYGSNHQECSAHPLRYLKDSILNEPDLEWNKQMRGLLQEMIHHRNSIDPDKDLDPKTIEGFESRYQEILALAKNEYEYEPPSKYYKDGYNLYLRMGKYKDNHLLFLHDKRVPATNNLSERLLRILKRKMKQVMTFRSFDSLCELCTSMSMIESLRRQNQNLYKSITSIFN
jgi:hypothetical protein